jgi:hypothetical protein
MCQHLLRHITRIQVRNFTPFPARDAFASALTQPSEQSQFTSYGSLSDDLDVALARKRTRRLSSASSVTVKSQGLEDHTNEESHAVGSGLVGEQRARKRTVSRVSAREFPTGVSSGSHPPLSGTGTTSRTNRSRTLSSTSGKGMVPTITLWQSHTQSTLEKVLQSRLVETFITIDVPSSVNQPGLPTKPLTSSRDRRPNSRASPGSKSKPHSPQNSPSRSSVREDQVAKRHSRTSTTPSTDSLAPTSASPNRRGVMSSTKLNGSTSKSASLASQAKTDLETRPIPVFISAIHRPSTNPQFTLDVNDFSLGTDPSTTRVIVQLWAKMCADADQPCVLVNDKGKGEMSDDVDTWGMQWRMAVKWDICLSDLVPLPDEVSCLRFGQECFKARRITDLCSIIYSSIKYATPDTFATRRDVLFAN